MSAAPGGPLIGREEESARTRALLLGTDARLVTLTGAPGVGKTRVLREVAHQLTREGLDVRAVMLRNVAEGGVLGAVARALGLGSRGTARGSIVARVAERMEEAAVVLVLDEAEHLLDEVAALVTTWIDGTTLPRMLVSSRERLDVPLEHVVAIEPLSVDHAIELLRMTLERSAPGRQPSPAEARELVTRVDCLPLGIELLASRLALLGIGDVLATTAGALPLRPLEEALEASFRTLDEQDRTALAALSTFRGGFSLDLASAVLGAESNAAECVASLTAASLLRRTDAADARSRFELLTVVRTFAERKLRESGRAAEVARRHLATFVGLAETENFSGQRADLLAAFRFAIDEKDARGAHRIALALDSVLVRQGPPELHCHVMTTALALPNEDEPSIVAQVERAYARFLALRGRFREALSVLERATSLAQRAGDHRGSAWLLSFECFDRRPLGDLDGADRAGLTALAYAMAERNLELEAMTEQALGLVDHTRGAHARACERYLRAATAARHLGDRRMAGIAEANRAASLWAMGDRAGAGECQEEARRCFASVDDRYHLARIAPMDAMMARESGDLDRAESLFVTALDGVRDQGDRAAEAEALLEGARIALLRRGRAQAEARLAEASLLLRDVEDVFLEAELAKIAAEVRKAARPDLTLRIGADGTIELAGTMIDLSRRAALRRIVVALAARHALDRSALTVAEALDAGWPGERMRADSGSARVYMAIRRLRAMGLEEVILTREDGYALAPLVTVVTSPPPPSSG